MSPFETCVHVELASVECCHSAGSVRACNEQIAAAQKPALSKRLRRCDHGHLCQSNPVLGVSCSRWATAKTQPGRSRTLRCCCRTPGEHRARLPFFEADECLLWSMLSKKPENCPK